MNLNKPLVSVICLCYNHERFVKEALLSVLGQTYSEIEVIVVDDFSADRSVELIEEIIATRPSIKFIRNKKNKGNCTSFNEALKHASGKYIIDFATDDVMFSDRIGNQVQVFEKLDSTYGVVYSNALIVDAEGRSINCHYTSIDSIPSGDVYEEVIRRYFISPPTMMIRMDVLKKLGGYDEMLTYEDFDFWVRSARMYKYFYQDEVLTKRRVVKGSHSSTITTKRETRMSASTFRVIQKVLWLNKSEKENYALSDRIKYEMRHAFYIQNYKYVSKYFNLLKGITSPDKISRFIRLASWMRLPVYPFYKFYLRLKK